MLYTDKNIVISDELELTELVEFMQKYNVHERYYTEYINYSDETISEPFILIKATIYRDQILPELSYVSTQKLLEVVSRKNESKEEQGYPRTKLLIVS